jgi:DNA invertase Pin-like site-specific DNA recombinase
MTYYGYIRVSTNGQADGLGPEIQEDQVRNVLGVTHWGMEVFRDIGVSGTLLQRPGLAEVLGILEKGDVLVVPRLDRLARDLITQELLLREIRNRGAKLLSCAEGEQAYLEDAPDDPSRKMIRQVLGAVAEYERSMTALRLRIGRVTKRAKGGFGGGEIQFGWRLNRVVGGLEPDEREQHVLAEMHRRHKLGQSCEQIARGLNADGLLPRKSTRWTRQRVHRVMNRPTRKLERRDSAA